MKTRLGDIKFEKTSPLNPGETKCWLAINTKEDYILGYLYLKEGTWHFEPDPNSWLLLDEMASILDFSGQFKEKKK